MSGRMALAFWYGRCSKSVPGPLSRDLAADAHRELCLAMGWEP
jgi:hypothetical protein